MIVSIVAMYKYVIYRFNQAHFDLFKEAMRSICGLLMNLKLRY